MTVTETLKATVLLPSQGSDFTIMVESPQEGTRRRYRKLSSRFFSKAAAIPFPS